MLSLLVGVLLWVSLSQAENVDEVPVVEVPQGSIVGRWDTSENGNKFQSFQGIPYGKINERFSRAVYAGDNFPNNQLLATSEGAQCPQLLGPYPLPGTLFGLNWESPSGN